MTPKNSVATKLVTPPHTSRYNPSTLVTAIAIFVNMTVAGTTTVTSIQLASGLKSIRAKGRMRTRNDDRGHGRPPRYSREQQPLQPRVTDQEIQKWISRQHGFVPESAWLLQCKEQFGLVAPGIAPKENPCPPEKVAAIQQAFRRFGLL
jgi:hypothetical protein